VGADELEELKLLRFSGSDVVPFRLRFICVPVLWLLSAFRVVFPEEAVALEAGSVVFFAAVSLMGLGSDRDVLFENWPVIVGSRAGAPAVRPAARPIRDTRIDCTSIESSPSVCRVVFLRL
jgi:hypothetical protein